MARTRVRLGGALAVVVGTALAANLVASGAGARPAIQTEPRVYVVKPGDTVWRIAVRLAGAEADPRPLVDQMVRVNHLKNAVIRPGQRLVLSS